MTFAAMSQRQRAQRLADLFAWLSSVADQGEPCPMNADIAARFGIGLNRAALLVQMLEKEGSIHVDRFNQCRRVTILATGRSTWIPAGAHRRHWSERGVVRARKTRSEDVVSGRNTGFAALPGGFRGDLPASRYVDRTPCARCGTRRDYGCRHHPLEGASA